MKARDILALPRRKVRHQLYRIRSLEESGTPDIADEIRVFFEAQPGFGGWLNFARIWDVAEEGVHYQIVQREMTEEEDWNQRLNAAAVVIGGGEGSL